jgi:hypothetical protein
MVRKYKKVYVKVDVEYYEKTKQILAKRKLSFTFWLNQNMKRFVEGRYTPVTGA